MVLIREYLQLDNGKDQWLLRYGTPKAGLNHQHPPGIEEVTRMMLLDESIVGRLRSEVAGCSAVAFSPATMHCGMTCFI